eukprot:9777940-Alexandrium_andersonii.AAC.1
MATEANLRALWAAASILADRACPVGWAPTERLAPRSRWLVATLKGLVSAHLCIARILLTGAS